MTTVLLAIGAYLLGAIPFGVLIGKAHGVDIRARGSGNIGATNIGRVVGRKWGYICLVADILKGLVPALSASLLLMHGEPDPREQGAVLLVALSAVLGHVFPIYLGFRGGKGVATTVGVAIGVWPYYTVAMAAALLAYGLARFVTGLVSAGSLTLAVAFPAALLVYLRVAGLSLDRYWPLQAVAVLLGLMIIVRHRGNIRRLFSGQELGLKRADQASTEGTSAPGKGSGG